MMRTRLGIFCVVMMLAATPAWAARPLATAKLFGVYVYADWCGNCKILGPRITAAREKAQFDKQAILFITLDLTDKIRIHQSVMLAQALGIGDFLQAQGSATGYFAILDAMNKNELKRFDSSSDTATIEKGIASLL